MNEKIEMIDGDAKIIQKKIIISRKQFEIILIQNIDMMTVQRVLH